MKGEKIELIYQMDQMDCGVACLQMILRYYGSELPIFKLREITNTDKNGVSALGLQKGLESLGFDSIVLKTESSLWKDPNLVYPLIANIVNEEGALHFVVVFDRIGDELFIADPRRGKYKVKVQAFSEWTGIVILAEVNQDYKTNIEKVGGISSFVPIVIKNKRVVIKIVLYSLLITALSILGTYYFQVVIDSLIPNKNIGLINIVSVSLIVSLVLRDAIEFVRNNLLVQFGQKMNLEIVYNYFSHVLYLPIKFFYTRKVGDLTSRFLDANRIIDALANATLSIFIDLTMFIIVGIFLALQDGYLFLITLLSLPLYSLIIIIYTKKIEKAHEQEMEQSASLTSYIVESLNGIETIKSFHAEEYIMENFKRSFNILNTRIKKNSHLNHSQMFFKSLNVTFYSTMVVWAGAFFIIGGNMTLGELITYNSMLVFFTTPLQNIVNLQTKLHAAEVASKRLNEILYIEQENQGVFQKNITHFNNSLELLGVNYSYNLKDLILRNIELKLNKNSKTAIVGMSGSGKSTLARILVKFHMLVGGELKIGGISYEKISNRSLREIMKYIPQDVFLFNGTIYENIMIGRKTKISISKLREYCRISGILDLIDSLPLGFETIIEEGGDNFSVGQKQRIAIARALASEAEVLIFDETLSGLDPISIDSISNNLISLEDRTIIFITHSFQIAQKCKNLIIMENGEIVANGQHRDLLSNNSYRKLWEKYTI